MFSKKIVFRLSLVLIAILLISTTAAARPLENGYSTSFTYQGRLTDGGGPATGSYDLEFKLYDALYDGVLLGTDPLEDVPVSGGLFTVQLDFGNVFDGRALYLQIGVRPGDSTEGYTPLTPRQQLTPAPYSLYALQSGNADTLDGQHSGSFLTGTSFLNASYINAGTLGNNFYNAYANLVAAGKLDNTSGYIPLSNGTLNNNLNADLLDGYHATDFILSSHNHWGQTWSGTGTGLTLSGGTTGLSGSGSTYGVYGTSAGTSSYGVYGNNTNGSGVYGNGSGANGTGINGHGSSTGVAGTGATGVYGASNSTGGKAIWGVASGGAGNDYAGYFAGNVQINGSLGLTSNALVTNLNADLLDGSHAASFASSGHNHWGQTWTGLGTGLTLSGGDTGISGSGATYGIYGTSTGINSYGVYGINSSNIGVYGNGGSVGVEGVGPIGVYGSSNAGTGVYGTGTTNGLYGHSLISGAKAIYGEAFGGAGNNNYAGYFDGNVRIDGNFSVSGTKSAVVNTKDYGNRLLYAVESPENWFEDFGTGQLVNGTAFISIEPIFAQTVNLSEDYHVFLTPVCETAILTFVTQKTSTGFSVSGVTLDNQPSQCSFDYRIVAKRLGYEDTRLAEQDMP
jgi:hypothetical protein